MVKPAELTILDPSGVQYLLQNDPFALPHTIDDTPLKDEEEGSEEESSGQGLGELPEEDDPIDVLPSPPEQSTWKPPELPLNETISIPHLPTLEPDNDENDNNDDNTTAFPEKPIPAVPMPWYFNYDSNTNYGPGEISLFSSQEGSFQVGVDHNNWGQVELAPNSYWEEFTANGWGPWKGVLEIHDPMNRNVCETGNMQSPIDVKDNGAACLETHQIFTHAGDLRLTGTNVWREIQGNKLRLHYDRRPCGDYNMLACSEPDPPFADFPNGWSGYADVLHVDFKVPGEHRIWTETFDAEMQIYHIHPERRRLPTQAVPIRAQIDGHNDYLEEALSVFAYEYEVNKAKCARKLREARRLHSQVHSLLGADSTNQTDTIDFDTWADFSTEFDRPGFDKDELEMHRRLQSSIWDPHHAMLVPSIHFYRYDGSLTEPPCGEFVSWFVCDTPMIISFEQLAQMKRILFTHVDANCRPTSIHHDESVARPIRPTGERPVWKCTGANYGPA